jgi:hypothetical protein
MVGEGGQRYREAWDMEKLKGGGRKRRAGAAGRSCAFVDGRHMAAIGQARWQDEKYPLFRPYSTWDGWPAPTADCPERRLLERQPGLRGPRSLHHRRSHQRTVRADRAPALRGGCASALALHEPPSSWSGGCWRALRRWRAAHPDGPLPASCLKGGEAAKHFMQAAGLAGCSGCSAYEVEGWHRDHDRPDRLRRRHALSGPLQGHAHAQSTPPDSAFLAASIPDAAIECGGFSRRPASSCESTLESVAGLRARLQRCSREALPIAQQRLAGSGVAGLPPLAASLPIAHRSSLQQAPDCSGMPRCVGCCAAPVAHPVTQPLRPPGAGDGGALAGQQPPGLPLCGWMPSAPGAFETRAAAASLLFAPTGAETLCVRRRDMPHAT